MAKQYSRTNQINLGQSRVDYVLRQQAICFAIAIVSIVYLLLIMLIAVPSTSLLIYINFGIFGLFYSTLSLFSFWWQNTIMKRLMTKLNVNKMLSGNLIFSGVLLIIFVMVQNSLFNYLALIVLLGLFVVYLIWNRSFGSN